MTTYQASRPLTSRIASSDTFNEKAFLYDNSVAFHQGIKRGYSKDEIKINDPEIIQPSASR
jgi:hypothetical protein